MRTEWNNVGNGFENIENKGSIKCHNFVAMLISILIKCLLWNLIAWNVIETMWKETHICIFRKCILSLAATTNNRWKPLVRRNVKKILKHNLMENTAHFFRQNLIASV